MGQTRTKKRWPFTRVVVEASKGRGLTSMSWKDPYNDDFIILYSIPDTTLSIIFLIFNSFSLLSFLLTLFCPWAKQRQVLTCPPTPLRVNQGPPVSASPALPWLSRLPWPWKNMDFVSCLTEQIATPTTTCQECYLMGETDCALPEIIRFWLKLLGVVVTKQVSLTHSLFLIVCIDWAPTVY